MKSDSPITVQKNVPLKALGTFRMGGKAKFFVDTQTPQKFLRAVEWARKSKFRHYIIAGGSNMVFPEGFFRGAIIRFLGGTFSRKKNVFTVDGGVPLVRVIQASLRAGFSGLESLSGIPGTIGGAIVGNAGAYGHSVSEVVERVEVWDGKKIRWISKKECHFSYRHSIFKEKQYVLLRAVLRFSKRRNPRTLREISKNIITLREKKYKPGIRCPGSFFKNVLANKVSQKVLRKIDRSKIIEGKIPTGHLLEEVGAKGMRVGGIRIAAFHGNLFINTGVGTANDVKKLSRILKRRVKKKFGILLEEEVRFL